MAGIFTMQKHSKIRKVLFPRPCGATGNDAQKLHAPAFAHFCGAVRMQEALYLRNGKRCNDARMQNKTPPGCYAAASGWCFLRSSGSILCREGVRRLYRFRLAVGRPRLGGRFRPGGGLAAGAEATDLRISAAGLDLYRGAEEGEAVMLGTSSGRDLLFTLPIDDVSCCNFRGRYRRRFHSDQSLAFPA